MVDVFQNAHWQISSFGGAGVPPLVGYGGSQPASLSAGFGSVPLFLDAGSLWGLLGP